VILEHAVLTIKAGSEREFEAVFPQAVAYLAASKGYISHTLQRSIESPNRYGLFVQWQTLEDHTQGFRGSPAFGEWRGLIGPCFDSPPVVEHYRLIAKSG
jgi:heme-degrading monooxygenase HmoA